MAKASPDKPDVAQACLPKSVVKSCLAENIFQKLASSGAKALRSTSCSAISIGS
uniref:Uncharacterized protein n=1 Tax=uncultured marine virus TaxID=186617 RepID=A0A0F7L602_9VIRU|nr:hypothetical protein [uncultured marine virus]